MERKAQSGVYAITCKVNGRKYIGSTRRLSTRWYQHRHQLDTGTHKNLELQADYDQYGLRAFGVSLIEECEGPELKRTEQRIITEHMREGAPLYNIRAATHTPVTTDAEFAAALNAL